jgi:hypothetical protein
MSQKTIFQTRPSFRREEERTLADADIWFAEAPAKHVVCIGGNHDFLLQSREFRFAHATFLEDRTVEIGGLLIHGSPWCPDLSGFAYYATNEQLIEKYGYGDWYSWSVDNWGCKWNCDAQDWTVDDYDDENLSIKFWFDSPWGPPVALYEFISQDDSMTIFGNYHEEGMAFVGRYEYGSDESYEYSDLESLDNIPEDIVDEWNLREMLEERAEWDEEEEINEENENGK